VITKSLHFPSFISGSRSHDPKNLTQFLFFFSPLKISRNLMHAPTTPTFSTRPSVPVWLWQSPKANPRSSRRDGRRRPKKNLKKFIGRHTTGRRIIREGGWEAIPHPRAVWMCPRARECGMASQPRARNRLGHIVRPESREVISFLYVHVGARWPLNRAPAAGWAILSVQSQGKLLPSFTCTRVRDGLSTARPQPVGPYCPFGVRRSYFLLL
jgi:hypothetical protein